jgi:hypothetical protein
MNVKHIPASLASQLLFFFPPLLPPVAFSVPLPILHEFVPVITEDQITNIQTYTRLQAEICSSHI